ncbi:unnamed protein product, partial [Amoebophrya sp. A25]
VVAARQAPSSNGGKSPRSAESGVLRRSLRNKKETGVTEEEMTSTPMVKQIVQADPSFDLRLSSLRGSGLLREKILAGERHELPQGSMRGS